jgi:hypothetical protein
MVPQWWQNKAAQWGRRAGGRKDVHGRAPFIADRGCGRRAARQRIRGRRNGGGEPCVQQVGGGHDLRWLARSECCPLCEAVDRGPRSFVHFPIYPKIGSTWKLKKKALPCSKNSQILHAGTLRYGEHCSPWYQHPIRNRD